MREATLLSLFESSVRQYPDNPLMLEKRDGAYRPETYREIHRRVEQFAAGLMDLGLRRGDRVALISEGRNDWVVAELGILYAGAINVPLSVKLQERSDLRFRLAHSECSLVVASASQAPKIRTLRDELPFVRHLLLLDDVPDRSPEETTIGEVCRRGRVFLANRRGEFEARRDAVRPSDPANICYTSGTTADPKGIVLTHRNYAANVEQASAIIPVPASYTSLLILPWDHCFAHTAGIYTLMKNGASMASVQLGKTPMETLRNIPENIREIRPTFLLSVPTLAKNFKKNIEAAVQQKGTLAQLLFRAGLAAGKAYNGDGWNRGRGLRMLLSPLTRIFDAILFRKIREAFGGRLEFFVGGGALLDIELQRFFYAIGVPMLQGYGLSESSPIISANVPAMHKLGSSGKVVPDLEVRICDDTGRPLPVGQHGEIAVKGENVMAGYWRNERATQEAIRDGWLYTGDLGYIDADGFLFVLGRTKSLLIANDGEKYSPEGIEETVASQSRFIDQMMLYNDQSPYTIALIVPNRDAILRWMKAHHHTPAGEDGQCAALRLLQREIDAYRPGGHHAGMFPERWLPTAFGVLPEGFTEQNGMVNTTLKMVRGKIVETHRETIEYLFSPGGKDVCNARNRDVVRSWA